MTAWVWKAVKLTVAFACGSVVLFGPSEVDQLAIGQILPRTMAVALLAVIAVASLVAAATPARMTLTKTWALRLAGAHLVLYGAFAALLKGLIALPTAGLAAAVGLLFLDRAAAFAEHRSRLGGKP